MKRKLAVTGVIIAVVLSLGSFLLYNLMTGPMYEPGQVRAGHALTEPLDPGQQPPGDFFDLGGGIRLRHFSSGEGPAAIVVHGGPGFPPSRSWPGLDLLASHRFLYYHQRGSGQSTRPFDRLDGGFFDNVETLERKLGLGAQIADIERVRRILGEERVVIVGHSFGAFIASLYAAEFPEHVAGMILIAPATIVKMPGEHPDLFTTIRERLPEERRAAFDDWLDRYLDMSGLFDRSETELAALTREMGPFWKEAMAKQGVSGADPDLDTETNGGWMTFAMYFSMGMRHDYSPHLARVTAPVLVVHGERDLQPEAASREYLDYFPNAELVVIPKAGHFPFFEEPRAFADAVAPFVGRLPR